MKILIQTTCVMILYITLLFIEGVFGQFTFSPVFNAVSADENRPVILSDLKNLSPYAAYGLVGFTEITLQFVINQEISSKDVSLDCPGGFAMTSIHVDSGIEYTVVYTPSVYCPKVALHVGDTQVAQVSWDTWGERLAYILDLSDASLRIQIERIEGQISRGAFEGVSLRYYEAIKSTFVEILASREKPDYLVPVPGSSIPTEPTYLPNSRRPYRQGYTDGIHHGWDFYGPFGAPIVSIDDGVIIKVKRDFTWHEFESIVFDTTGDEYLPHTNLDILRGNQVWIKTMTGDVVFYSHFNEVDAYLQEGDVVRRGQYLGTIGSTGVPFEGYDQYHLHIPLMMNPLDPNKVGKNSLLDIMRWDWYAKHKTPSWILEHQSQLFVYE